MSRNRKYLSLTAILVVLLCLFSESKSDVFSEDGESVDYVNDDPDSSGEDDITLYIPVPKKHDLPKSRPDPVTDDPTVTDDDSVDPESNIEMSVSVKPTSFKPIDVSFEHQYSVTTTQDLQSQDENELDEKSKHTESLDTSRPIKKDERIRLHSSLPAGSQPDQNKQAQPHTTDRADSSHSFNDSNAILDQSTERTRNGELSVIAKIGIAMGCVVALWLLLCPIVCIVCRNRDKKKQKRIEEQKMKNGINTNNHQKHPLTEELVLTEMGLSDAGKKHTANGKAHECDAKHEDELERLNKSNEPSDSCNGSLSKRAPGGAPLASVEALDTEV